MGQKITKIQEIMKSCDISMECITHIANNSIDRNESKRMLSQLLDDCVYHMVANGFKRKEVIEKLEKHSKRIKLEITRDIIGGMDEGS